MAPSSSRWAVLLTPALVVAFLLWQNFRSVDVTVPMDTRALSTVVLRPPPPPPPQQFTRRGQKGHPPQAQQPQGPPAEKVASMVQRDGLRDSSPLSEWFLRWSMGKPLTAENVPLKKEDTIPNRMFMTWKAKTLPENNAQRFWDNWALREPQLERVVLDDAECALLAGFFPDLKPRYDGLPLNVMRADICRVLAIYYFGGYYKDLDVDHRKPLAAWINPKDDVAYGWEDEEHLCQWFFAAKPGDPCVWNILQQITNLITNPKAINFNENIEAVIDITGPGVWTDGMQGCPFPPKYTYDEMKFHNIYHEYGSQKWGGKDYKPWIEERMGAAGWDSVWPTLAIHPYFLTPGDKALAPLVTDQPKITISKVTMSSVGGNLGVLHGPQNAFDGRLDTFVETKSERDPWIEFEFAEPITIGTVRNPGANHLTGIRLWNRHRDANAGVFAEAFFMDLYDANGKMIHRCSKGARMTKHFLFNIAGMENKVKRVRFWKRRISVLTLAEIQLHSDPACTEARRLVIAKDALPTATNEPSTPEFIHLITQPRDPCPDSRAVSPNMGFSYTLCGAEISEMKDCKGFILETHNRTAEVDAPFVAQFHKWGCSLTTVGPVAPRTSHHRAQGEPRTKEHKTTWWCAENATWTQCDVFAKMVDATGLTEADVLYVDLTTSEWTDETTLLPLLNRFKAHTLFLPVRMSPEVVTSPVAVARLKALLDKYELYSTHVNLGEGHVGAPNQMQYPKEFHLSLRLRTSA